MGETIIVQVGGEGGDITLFGRRIGNEQWVFRRSSSDSSWSMIDEARDADPGPAPDPVWVKTWNEAIALLDRNPWAQLVPLAFLGVAIAFPSAIVSAVCAINIGLFVYMAIDDERVLRQSPLAADYKSYRMRIGMFLPRLAGKR
jgi:hypothetical protein